MPALQCTPAPAVPAAAACPGLAPTGTCWPSAAATAGMSQSAAPAPGLQGAGKAPGPGLAAGTRLKRPLSSGGTSSGSTATSVGGERALVGGPAGSGPAATASSSSRPRERRGPLCRRLLAPPLRCHWLCPGDGRLGLGLPHGSGAGGCQGGLAGEHNAGRLKPAAGLDKPEVEPPPLLLLLVRSQRRAQRSQAGVRSSKEVAADAALLLSSLLEGV